MIFRLPDYTGNEEKQHYSFLKKFLHAEENSIWLAGSSVALYGADPALAGRIINTDKKIYLFSHQGMNPVHLIAWSGEIIRRRPSIFVLYINPVDLRPERYAVPGSAEGDPCSSENKALFPDLIRLEHYEKVHPRGMLREFGFGGTYGNYFSAEENLWLAAASLLQSAGRKKLMQDAVSQYTDAVFREGRFYHDYQGRAGRDGEISRQGYSGREVHIKTEDSQKIRFRYEVPVKGNALPVLNVFRNPAQSCSEAALTRPDFRIELTGRWQTLSLNGLQKEEEILLCFPEDRYFPESDDHLSARFSRFAGSEISFYDSEGAVKNRVSREDVVFLNMSDSDYAESYEKRLRSYSRSGTEYLRLLEESKRRLAECEGFSENLPALFFLREFSKRIRIAGIPFIIINAPENSLTLRLYAGSPWYKGYTDFLKEISDDFYDASELLKMQEFYDSHHPTRFGKEKFTRYAASLLKERLKN